MFTSQNEAALFIDFENIHTSVRNNLNAFYVDYRLLLTALEPYGRLAIRRAYSDWAENAKHQDALARFGIESRNAFGRGKNVSDIFLAVEAMETMLTNPEIQTYIIVSGDGDFSVLVHRLRNHHKQVIGMGVRGATSQTLVEICDEFIFYDDLVQAQPEVVKEPPPPVVKAPPPPPPPPVKTVDEDRLQRLGQLLDRALPPDGSWINGATLVYRLRGLNRNFDREMQQHGFERFRDFLESWNQLVDIRSAPGKGHMEVRRKGVEPVPEPEPEPEPLPLAPELTVEDYLDMLEQVRPRVTPSRYRPTLILKIYDLMIEHQPPTLNKLKAIAVEALHPFGEALVEEVIHQLYHTYSFELDRIPDMPQWDRPCRFQEHIHSGFDLLDNCDLRILQRLKQGLPEDTVLDALIVAHILYGDNANPHVLKRTNEMLARLETAG